MFEVRQTVQIKKFPFESPTLGVRQGTPVQMRFMQLQSQTEGPFGHPYALQTRLKARSVFLEIGRKKFSQKS